jgi:hypothetical protein
MRSSFFVKMEGAGDGVGRWVVFVRACVRACVRAPVCNMNG